MRKIDGEHVERSLEFLAEQIGAHIINTSGEGSPEFCPAPVSNIDFSIAEKVNAICEYLGIEMTRRSGVVALKTVTRPSDPEINQKAGKINV